MTFALLFLVAVLLGALGVAGVAWVSGERREEIVTRTLAGTDRDRGRRSALLDKNKARREPLLDRLVRRFPSIRLSESKMQEKLVHAGFEGVAAPFVFASIRVVALLAIPIFWYLWGVRRGPTEGMLVAGGWLVVAWIAPRVFLERQVRYRRERIRRALPDALDLLVVCVEAGISLDAAILRVAREMQLTHEDLGQELLAVNRKTNAGITREEALRGLFIRTGVEELRMLASSLIQCEKWGTSISKVLRVSAATFRRKRRQNAEKQVAMAPVKMTFPLVVLILPALFIIILGPAMLSVIESLRGVVR
jgi:tight adherence protein C